MPRVNLPSFARGEIAPALYGRVDTAAYQIALRKARNFIVHAYGGVSNRAGLKWIGPVKDHGNPPILIPFEFKTSDTYILEFGHQYMRVIRNDGHVLETAKTVTAATAANPVVITCAGHGYSNGDEVFFSGVRFQLDGNRYKIANVTANTFELQSQLTGANVDGTAFDAFTSGGTVARVYEIATPYSLGDLPTLKHEQSADVITLTHSSYPVHELSRSDHDAWTLAEKAFAPDTAAPTGQTVTVNTTGAVTVRYRVTAIASDTLEESLPATANTSTSISGITQANPAVVTSSSHGLSNGDEVELSGIAGMTELNGRRFEVNNVTTNTFELFGEDSTAYSAYSSGGTVRRTFVQVTNSAAAFDNTIAWSRVSGAARYAVYREYNGLYGLIGETEVETFNDENIEANLDISHPRSRDPFRGTGNYPGTSGYYEQRQIFAATLNRPDTSWYTKTGAYANLTASSPLQADDAIIASLAARKVNEIRHFVPGNDLLIFTSGSEWRVNSGGDAAFSYDTIRQRPQSEWGSSHRKPIVVGNTVLFATPNDATVRSFGYSLQLDGYTGSNLTLLVPHFFRNMNIVAWDYSASPDPIVYVVRSDGKALAMTFDQEQEVIAWTQWDTQGKFLWTAVIRPSASDRHDAPYFVVERAVGANKAVYIERQASREFEDVRDCFFVDSGRSFDNPVAITGVTTANPVVVTAPAHGLSNGALVDISDIVWVASFDSSLNETQPDQLNGRRYKAANVTTNTFELTNATTGANIDGSAFDAYVSGGFVREPATTIYGLEHLEGWQVACLADGNVVEGLIVSGGAVTLPRAASRVHVGLRYIADMETLNVEAPQGQGTVQGRRKRVSKVDVLFERSRGLFIGPTPGDLVEVKWRENEAMGEPTRLLTDFKEVVLRPQWNNHGRVFARQQYPLPCTILSITSHLEVGDE